MEYSRGEHTTSRRTVEAVCLRDRSRHSEHACDVSRRFSMMCDVFAFTLCRAFGHVALSCSLWNTHRTYIPSLPGHLLGHSCMSHFPCMSRRTFTHVVSHLRARRVALSRMSRHTFVHVASHFRAHRVLVHVASLCMSHFVACVAVWSCSWAWSARMCDMLQCSESGEREPSISAYLA